jgi:hypothetical protein
MEAQFEQRVVGELDEAHAKRLSSSVPWSVCEKTSTVVVPLDENGLEDTGSVVKAIAAFLDARSFPPRFRFYLEIQRDVSGVKLCFQSLLF